MAAPILTEAHARPPNMKSATTVMRVQNITGTAISMDMTAPVWERSEVAATFQMASCVMTGAILSQDRAASVTARRRLRALYVFGLVMLFEIHPSGLKNDCDTIYRIVKMTSIANVNPKPDQLSGFIWTLIGLGDVGDYLVFE
jgi:hypothetical protein